MKIISVWSLEFDECSQFSIEELPKGRYVLRFTCGLVLSSWFFARLSMELRHKAILTHIDHHILNHTVTALAPWGLASYSSSRKALGTVRMKPNPIRWITCGPVCEEFALSGLGIDGIIDRSDIGYYPLAKVKEFDQVFELRLTASNQLLCSCGEMGLSGTVCSHVISLLSGKAKGVVWGKEGAGAKAIKRKMLLDG